MKILNREDVRKISEEFREVLDTEKNHNHALCQSTRDVIRWQADKQIELFIDSHNLNDILVQFQICGHTKNNSEIWRAMYRAMGYSLYGYWEIFFWEANNENAHDYVAQEYNLSNEKLLEIIIAINNAKPFDKELIHKINILKEKGILQYVYPYLDEVRKQIEETAIPQPLKNPDFTELVKMCNKHLKDIKNGEVDDDDERYIYEKLIETLYGENVWEWINKQPN